LPFRRPCEIARVAAQIGLDLLTTGTAAAASAGEEVTAAKNHKVGSFSLVSMKMIFFSSLAVA
jgi:hypothetical protein